MLVTAQRKLEFGAIHQPVKERLLDTYYFKSLPNPKKTTAGWLRKNTMECVVREADQKKCCKSQDNTDRDEEQSAEDKEGILKEQEKEAIQKLSLSSVMMEEITVGDSSDENIEEITKQSGTANDAVTVLKEALEKLQLESLQYRHVNHMLWKEEGKQKRANQATR